MGLARIPADPSGVAPIVGTAVVILAVGIDRAWGIGISCTPHVVSEHRPVMPKWMIWGVHVPQSGNQKLAASVYTLSVFGKCHRIATPEVDDASVFDKHGLPAHNAAVFNIDDMDIGDGERARVTVGDQGGWHRQGNQNKEREDQDGQRYADAEENTLQNLQRCTHLS